VTKRLTATQADELSEDLRSLLQRIDAGELVASTATVHRIQGAIVALEVVSGRSSQAIVSDLIRPD
jgi:hypothetical protein